MSTRREAREWAVQLLFQQDFNQRPFTEIFEEFWKDKTPDKATRTFTESTVKGVADHLADIDGMIRKYAQHWDIKRMGVVDRNVMRMAVYELLYVDDIPENVSINEAIDIAKYYSSRESGKFVNGILDRIAKGISENPVPPSDNE